MREEEGGDKMKEEELLKLIRRRIQQRYNMCAHCKRQAIRVFDKQVKKVNG